MARHAGAPPRIVRHRRRGGTVKTVSDILAAKGSEVFSIGPDATVFEALRSLADHNVGALVVLHDGDLVGIMSERDYARKVILLDRASKTTTVAEIMSTQVMTVAPTASIEDCMEMMTERHFRHLPVVEEGHLIGMVSIGDVVRAMIAHLAAMVDQLESYIRGV
jgi:CBS domain-containing protein